MLTTNRVNGGTEIMVRKDSRVSGRGHLQESSFIDVGLSKCLLMGDPPSAPKALVLNFCEKV